MSSIERYDGFDWYRGADTHGRVIGDGHEPGLAPLIPDKGRVAVDVGAHIGHYTLPLARRFEAVWAFEPDPEAARQLRINLLLNRIGNVAVFDYAVWSVIDEIELDLKPGESRIGKLPGSTGRIRVPAWPLDELPLVGERVDFVKIDVEGAEVEVLRGMRKILARWRPMLLIEVHDAIYDRRIAVALKEILKGHGYAWRDIPWAEGYATERMPRRPVPHWWVAEVAA